MIEPCTINNLYCHVAIFEMFLSQPDNYKLFCFYSTWKFNSQMLKFTWQINCLIFLYCVIPKSSYVLHYMFKGIQNIEHIVRNICSVILEEKNRGQDLISLWRCITPPHPSLIIIKSIIKQKSKSNIKEKINVCEFVFCRGASEEIRVCRNILFNFCMHAEIIIIYSE